MAQAGTQVCLVIAIVLSVCVHVHVCVYLHVAQCVYRASAWEDKRRSTIHPRHQSRLILVCVHTAHISIINLWWSLSAVYIKARPGSGSDWIFFFFSVCFISLARHMGGVYHVRSALIGSGTPPVTEKGSELQVRSSWLFWLPVEDDVFEKRYVVLICWV